MTVMPMGRRVVVRPEGKAGQEHQGMIEVVSDEVPVVQWAVVEAVGSGCRQGLAVGERVVVNTGVAQYVGEVMVLPEEGVYGRTLAK